MSDHVDRITVAIPLPEWAEGLAKRVARETVDAHVASCSVAADAARLNERVTALESVRDKAWGVLVGVAAGGGGIGGVVAGVLGKVMGG